MSVAYDQKEVVGTFRLVRGNHNEGGHKYRAREAGNNIVRSKSNLLKHNNPAGPRKFIKITEEEAKALTAGEEAVEEEGTTASTHSKEELRSLSVADLKELAADEEIDLSGANLKEDIVSIIASHLSK